MPKTFRAAITSGFDGDVLEECDYPNWDNALAFIRRTAPKYIRRVRECWNFNTLSENAPASVVTVIDFGSHVFFGRITESPAA